MTGNVTTACRTCGAKFGGNAAHCSACHQTFSGDTAFDRHLISRVTAGCHDPGQLLDKHDPPRYVFRWDSKRLLWRLADYSGRWSRRRSLL